MLSLHIAAGSLSLFAGAVALLTRKGSRLHRTGGLVFVAAMLIMAASAIPLAIQIQERSSVMGGALTFYLVLTSLLTIRRPLQQFDWVNIGAAPGFLPLVVILLMFYWIARVRLGKGYR